MSRWVKTQNLSIPGSVNVYFYGLFAFCPKNHGCEIGIYETGHTFWMEVLQGDVPVQIPIPASFSQIVLAIDPLNPAVTVYESSGLNRYHGDRYDFRWLLDLESKDDGGYGGPLGKKGGYFTRKIYAAQGTFYTLQPTQSTFSMSNSGIGLGHVAEIVGAAITLAAGQKLNLFIDPHIDPNPKYSFTPGTMSHIQFGNTCPPDNKSAGDFDQVFDLLTDSSDAYDLDVEDDNSNLVVYPYPDFFPKRWIPAYDAANIGARSRGYLVEIDDAPCMGAGFGETDGFP